jgi:hypothetical protein
MSYSFVDELVQIAFNSIRSNHEPVIRLRNASKSCSIARLFQSQMIPIRNASPKGGVTGHELHH